jgi:O-Antigen ligase
MLANIKALVVVVTVAAIVFALAKPICSRFMAPEEFMRRQIVWFVLTIAAFLSPSFWIFALIAAPTMAIAAQRDSNPLALYMLLIFAIPPVTIQIPTIGIGQLFDMTHVRLMNLVILLPFAWQRLQASKRPNEGSSLAVPDALLLIFCVWQLILLMPYESATHSARRAFLMFLDTWIVYYAFSRMGGTRKHFSDALATLCLSAAVCAPLAVFESHRQWLLFTGIPAAWGSPNVFAWLFRGDNLRAQVSTGHALALGYLLAMAIGGWMYLKSARMPRTAVASVSALLLIGLLHSFSRGPWLTAALAAIVYLALAPQGTTNLMKTLLGGAVLCCVMALTPMGQEIFQSLPFVGSAEQENVAYRQQLAETSWMLIQQNPWIGNPFVLLQMEELRQGQGIIDLVNGYATVALFYGLVGLAMYLGVFIVVLSKGLAGYKQACKARDTDMALLGAVLFACLIANLFYMATAGLFWMQWLWTGILAGYAVLQASREPADPAVSRPQGRVPMSAFTRPDATSRARR